MILCPPIEETALLAEPNLQQLPMLSTAQTIGMYIFTLEDCIHCSWIFLIPLAIDDFHGLSGPTSTIISCKLHIHINVIMQFIYCSYWSRHHCFWVVNIYWWCSYHSIAVRKRTAHSSTLPLVCNWLFYYIYISSFDQWYLHNNVKCECLVFSSGWTFLS